ncbi:13313_t:CDS:2 [Funneliformis geosporum]|uniref:13313_t:CDS:1 n=1 Tax=Funneliformis geosporum TaxID=1117311 RepID=A0A9W4TA49_9GLOM|nr:13313_t:CDS:2 [Funneliformis geosporum]
MPLPPLIAITSKGRRVYSCDLVINKQRLLRLIIDPHYEKDPPKRPSAYQYFTIEDIQHNDKSYCLKENYAFPSEAELKEIREKVSHPNYPYKNKILSPNASGEEKFKYQICQAILVYQQENNLPVEEVATKIAISLNKTYDLLLGKIKGFRLKELANYLEKLHVPFEITVRNDKARESKHLSG